MEDQYSSIKQMLNVMTSMGVPVPLSLLAADGGFCINNFLIDDVKQKDNMDYIALNTIRS